MPIGTLFYIHTVAFFECLTLMVMFSLYASITVCVPAYYGCVTAPQWPTRTPQVGWNFYFLYLSVGFLGAIFNLFPYHQPF